MDDRPATNGDDRQATDGMESWLDRMNREFQEAAQRWSGGTAPLPTMDAPDADVLDRDDDYLVTVDLPGFDSDDVEVRVTNDTLRIDADRTEMAGVDEDAFVRRERRQESISRQVTLPAPVEPDQTEATMEQGVLRVTLPKAAAADRGTQIDIS